MSKSITIDRYIFPSSLPLSSIESNHLFLLWIFWFIFVYFLLTSSFFSFLFKFCWLRWDQITDDTIVVLVCCVCCALVCVVIFHHFCENVTEPNTANELTKRNIILFVECSLSYTSKYIQMHTNVKYIAGTAQMNGKSRFLPVFVCTRLYCVFVCCCACMPYGIHIFSLALYVYINVIHCKFVYIFLFPLTPSVFFTIQSYTYARTHTHTQSKTNKQIHVVFTGIWSSLFTANGSMSARTEKQQLNSVR